VLDRLETDLEYIELFVPDEESRVTPEMSMSENQSNQYVCDDISIGSNPRIQSYVLLGVKADRRERERLIIGENAFIRSHSVIYAATSIGANFQTGHGVLIRENNSIADNVSVGSHTVIERGNRIGNNVRIHSNCFIPEFTVIEDYAWIGPCVTILNVLHPPCPRFEDCAKHVVIGPNAKIGGNVTVGPRVTIGANSLVGMGSVVTSDIPGDVVAFGNPARPIKSIRELACETGYYDTPYEWEGRKR
jgi:acetyltransferase-like isoleucine patch superfamily enzyme